MVEVEVSTFSWTVDQLRQSATTRQTDVEMGPFERGLRVGLRLGIGDRIRAADIRKIGGISHSVSARDMKIIKDVLNQPTEDGYVQSRQRRPVY